MIKSDANWRRLPIFSSGLGRMSWGGRILMWQVAAVGARTIVVFGVCFKGVACSG